MDDSDVMEPQGITPILPQLETTTNHIDEFSPETPNQLLFGSDVRPKRNANIDRPLVLSVPRVGQGAGERQTPTRDWAPGPSNYSPRHTRVGGAPLGFNSPNADHSFSHTDLGSQNSFPGRATANSKPIYGGGRLGMLSDLTLPRSKDAETPGPRFNIRSEPIIGPDFKAVTSPVYSYGARASFDKLASRLNSQGLSLAMTHNNFANGRDSAIDHPSSQKYLPMLCYDGNRIGDSSKVSFKSCLPYSSLGRKGLNAYLGERFASSDNYGIHSPGPLAYDTVKVYESVQARRYNANGPNSRTIKYSMRPKLMAENEFKIIEKREREMPGPGAHSPTKARDGSGISVDQGLGVKIGTEGKMVFAQEKEVPFISRNADQDVKGKYSPGPVYYPIYGTIEYENSKKNLKGYGFGASSRMGTESGKTWTKSKYFNSVGSSIIPEKTR